MELSLSGWVTLACAVLIVAVLGHAFWLRWRTQRNRLRIQIDPAAIPTSGADDLDLLRGELPNGGARVREPGELDPVAKRAETPPVLLDTVAYAQEISAGDSELTTGPRASHGDDARGLDLGLPELTARRPAARASAEKASAEKASAGKSLGDAADNDTPLAEHEELFVMQLLCRNNEGFELAALMATATQAGMKFGDFNIFHRYKDARAGRNRIEYSMANAVEPGAFDLSDGEARTRGVAFFMRLPLTTGSEPIHVFEDMLKVVQSIAQQFDGEVLDERQGVMSMQTIEHCRERIHEFTRRQQIRG